MAQKPLILAVETSGRIGSVAIAAGERMLAEAAFSGPMRHSSEIFPAIRDLLNRFGRKPRHIEHIYISVGPGSFTGLRIAVTMAKTMHLANPPRRTKIVAVDTLDVIAANATDYIKQGNTDVEKIATILDAKRGQFYIAIYQRQNSQQRLTTENAKKAEKKINYELNSANSANSAIKKWEKIFPDSLMTASQFLDRFAGQAEPIWLLGEGLVYYADKFKPVPSGVEGAEGIHFFDEQYWTPRAAKVHLLSWKMACAGQFADPVTLQPNYLRRPEAEEKIL